MRWRATSTPTPSELTQRSTFALVVFGVFIVHEPAELPADRAAQPGPREAAACVDQVRDLLVPMLPGQVAAGALAALLAVAYTNLGFPVLLGSVLVILIFQYLAMALLRSEDRAEQLEARSMHLASLQLGVLTTLVETLALRDRMTARHAAAVARYARALAQEAGCSEAEQDVAHTAGLLHDIGKFALPDRILNAEVLSDEDWALIRRHPQDGATLVGRLDGYGPVADAILYHHEHIDGSGYPAGLIGNEIPLLSRILAICSAYDTMTSRDSYRSPMTPQDAIAELRRMAGRQFDAELVSSFVAMLEREGPATFALATRPTSRPSWPSSAAPARSRSRLPSRPPDGRPTHGRLRSRSASKTPSAVPLQEHLRRRPLNTGRRRVQAPTGQRPKTWRPLKQLLDRW